MQYQQNLVNCFLYKCITRVQKLLGFKEQTNGLVHSFREFNIHEFSEMKLQKAASTFVRMVAHCTLLEIIFQHDQKIEHNT